MITKKYKKNIFDVITCMEIIEHIKNKEKLIELCKTMIKKEGFLLISTLNKNLCSLFTNIIIAEKILKILPNNTHKYEDFISPSKLCCMLYKNNFKIIDIKGIQYNPTYEKINFIKNLNSNYIICAKKI